MAYNYHTPLRFLIQYWEHHSGSLQDLHRDWARQHITFSKRLKHGTCLYKAGDREKRLFFVVSGMLARRIYDPETGASRLFSIALPGMALLTTKHLYSSEPNKGDIIVLRSNTIVVELSYKAILDFKELDPTVNRLINILNNKKRQQLVMLRYITHGCKPFQSYLKFVHELPELHSAFTQMESAQLLGISKTTVQSAHYYLIKGKKRKKSSNS